MRSRHPNMPKSELVYSHIRRRQLSFSLGAPLVGDTIGGLWIITHPPLFQPLSSPPPTPLDIVTKTHRGGFFLLIPLPLCCFLLQGVVVQVAVCWEVTSATACLWQRAVWWHKTLLPGPMTSAQLQPPWMFVLVLHTMAKNGKKKTRRTL